MKCEDLDKVVIGDDLERFFQVGAQLPLQEKEQLAELNSLPFGSLLLLGSACSILEGGGG